MEFWPIFEKWSMADYKNAVAMCTGLRSSVHHFMRIHTSKSTQLCQMKLAIVHLFNNFKKKKMIQIKKSVRFRLQSRKTTDPVTGKIVPKSLLLRQTYRVINKLTHRSGSMGCKYSEGQR